MPNHLCGETNPYLLQHAANPDNCYFSGKQALVQRPFPGALVLNLFAELVDFPSCLNNALPTDQTVNAVIIWVSKAHRCLPTISVLQELLHICEVQGKIVVPI